MGTIANAKVTHYYNCYNGDFIGCLRISSRVIINFLFYAKIVSMATSYNMHFFGGLPIYMYLVGCLLTKSGKKWLANL